MAIRLTLGVAMTGLLGACAGVAPAETPKAEQGAWISLFNGENLEGWSAKIRGQEAGVNFKDTFRVEDGKIVVNYDQYDGAFKKRFGHLFYETPFSHYVLKMQYRFVGEQLPDGPEWAWRNSGVMVHGQTRESMGKTQPFPRSIEVQLLGGPETEERPTANLCTPGTNVVMGGEMHKKHCTESNSKTYRGDQWVNLKIVVRGSKRITHYVNGKQVMTYTKPQKNDGTLLTGGTISLQSESTPVEFRNIKLKPLDKDAPIKSAALKRPKHLAGGAGCCGGAAK
jgi:hypothetical protein